MAIPGVNVTPVTGTTSETGDEAKVRVTLNTQPLENVIITFTSDNLAEGKFVDNQGNMVDTLSLTFTDDNWNKPQTVTVVGMDDYPPKHIFDGDISYNVTGVVKSNDIDYIRGIVVPTITLVNEDDPLDEPKAIRGDQNPENFRDQIHGGHGNDTISGGYDIDFLYGEMGNDKITGMDDDDRLFGEDGNDTLSGGDGVDSIEGGPGDDEINGDNDTDLLQGNDGNDVLNGGNQNDTLEGGKGNDKLYGQEGDDSMLGQEGNDILDGGTGTDSMDGGAGADTYYVDAAIMDVITDTGKDGSIDTVIVPSVLKYTLPKSIENGALAPLGNGNLTGNTGNNGLSGNDGKNVLDGGAGNDVINAGGGNDKQLGGAGNDTAVAGAGSDTMSGGTGIDTGDYTNVNVSVTVDLTTGKANDGKGVDTLSDIENILTGAGSDVITGSTVSNVLDTGNGNDKVDAGAGNDTVYGGAGNDVVNGGDGNDRITAGTGSDNVTGGTGVDTVDYSAATTAVAVDLTTGSATDGTGTDVLSQVEIIVTGLGGDSLTGDSASNGLVTGAGNDTVEAGAGNDVVDAGTGNDMVEGGTGNDILSGGTGDDEIVGGEGTDVLKGGDGADDFVVVSAADTGTTTATADVIQDFDASEGDQIDLSGFGAHWTFAANGFTGVDHQVTFQSDSKLVAFDMDGDSKADFVLNLQGVVSLSAADFILA